MNLYPLYSMPRWGWPVRILQQSICVKKKVTGLASCKKIDDISSCFDTTPQVTDDRQMDGQNCNSMAALSTADARQQNETKTKLFDPLIGRTWWQPRPLHKTLGVWMRAGCLCSVRCPDISFTCTKNTHCITLIWQACVFNFNATPYPVVLVLLVLLALIVFRGCPLAVSLGSC